MSNNVAGKTNVITTAKAMISDKEKADSNYRAEFGTMAGLGLSSLFTIIYMILALGFSLIGFGWSPIAAYSIGGLLGIAAIMPGEGGVWIWKTKLKTDPEINDTQIWVAWAGGLIAAISAAISTVSFFAYLLQPIMPGWYNPETASGINIVNIAASWAVFGMCIFIYSAAGDAAKHNRDRAKSLNLLMTADNDLIAGIAAGKQNQTTMVLALMDREGLFLDDSLHEVGGAMGLSEKRVKEIQETVQRERDKQNVAGGTAVSQTNQKPYRNFYHADYDFGGTLWFGTEEEARASAAALSASWDDNVAVFRKDGTKIAEYGGPKGGIDLMRVRGQEAQQPGRPTPAANGSGPKTYMAE